MPVELAATLTQFIASPVDKVFTSWVSPDSLQNWFWPFPAQYEVDLRVGGSFHFSCEAIGVSGRFIEVEAPDRLVYTWGWDGENAETQVTVAFGAAPNGTKVSLVHTGNADVEARDNHAKGWRDCIARLGPFLSRRSA